MQKPKVSICLPTYKQPELLKRALDSIFMQSFGDYEIIISDDTPDSSIEDTINSYNSSKIKYFKNTNKKSSTSNWNNAIKKASGEYIKMIHHDDWFSYEYSLENFVKALDEKPNCDFAFCTSRNVFEKGEVKSYNKPSSEEIARIQANPYHIFFRNIIGAPSATMYRSSVNHIYDENTVYTVDWDLYLRILIDNPDFIFIEEDLMCITTESQNQVTDKCVGDKNIHAKESFYMIKKFKKELNTKETVFLCNILYQYSILSKDEFEDIKIPNNLIFNMVIFLNKSKNTRAITKLILKTLYNLAGEKFKEIELKS